MSAGKVQLCNGACVSSVNTEQEKERNTIQLNAENRE